MAENQNMVHTLSIIPLSSRATKGQEQEPGVLRRPGAPAKGEEEAIWGESAAAGQIEGEGAALADLRCDRDVAAVAFDDALHDGQAQAGALLRHLFGGRGAVEGLKDVGHLFG